MLAISFAIALALHDQPLVTGTSTLAAANVQATVRETSDLTLVPFGQAYGYYDYDAGHMLALLDDASGTPLWVLDAYVYESGVLDGDLLPLEYATNPVNSAVQLSVSGLLVLDASGKGTLNAFIFQFGGGAIPVFPVGKIQGLIQPNLFGQKLPPLAGASHLIAIDGDSGAQAYGPQVAGSGIIVCPKGPTAGFDAARSMDQAGSSLAGNAQSGATGAAGHQTDGGAIVCPKGPVANVQSMGSMAQAGFAQKGNGGMPPIVDPARIGASGNGASVQTSAGAKGESSQFAPVLQGPSVAHVALRWWLDR